MTPAKHKVFNLKNLFKTCKCLKKSKYKKEANNLIASVMSLYPDTSTDIVKVLVAYNLSQGYDFIRYKLKKNPIKFFKDLLKQNTEFVKKCYTNPVKKNFKKNKKISFEEITKYHYSTLFTAFGDGKYYNEPQRLLRQRLEKNNYNLKEFRHFHALDAGCGNGRYTLALKKLGMKKVVGIDFSERNLRDAKKRIKKIGIKNVEFKKASVLSLPFKNNSFDFVFSNGVLHHTKNPQKGLNEIIRVLKKNGKSYLNLMVDPGGIKWDHIELSRIILFGIDNSLVYNIFSLLGVPADKAYYNLDHMMVPINIRYKRSEVISMLKKSGAKNIRVLKRGHDIDEDERIFKREKYSIDKYGLGYNRIYFEK